jgi:RNA polymerase sigma-70 factor (ECF subfamily)
MTNGDEELLPRIRSGAVEDFQEVVRRYQARVFAILRRYERDGHRVEDLAQDTFLKVWRALDQYDGRVPFEHWLSRITVHVALDHLRKEKRRRNEIGLPELGESALDWLRTDDEERGMEVTGARELLEVAMADLSPAERIVITLLEIEGHSVKEISALTGSSGVAVRVRALRGRAKLRKALERLEHEANERTKTKQNI